MRGVSYLGGVLNRKTHVVLGRGALNKGCSSKTLCTNIIKSGFPFLVECPPNIGDVAPNWDTTYLSFVSVKLS